MSLNYDMRELDIDIITEWWDRKEFGAYYSNQTLFESFMMRLMVMRPSNDGTIRADEAKTLILRNAIWEKHVGGIHIPHMFIRRMIGLKTNVFPAYSSDDYAKAIGRIIEEDAIKQLNDEFNGWDNF